MKALSIQQPWAYCITHGSKRVENRRWSTAHRGLLLLHAGKSYQRGLESAIHADSPEVDVAGMLSAPRGAIVGYCRLVECIRPGDDRWLSDAQRIWADPSQFKFLLAGVRALAKPIPWKGALGLFEVPAEIVDGEVRLTSESGAMLTRLGSGGTRLVQ